ncbi:unnamed protein product [Prorocentrum cordatum]|uniref:EF-hand domain-containing protein n=1 Tax=Prorocentrum cordatum TaxID=2364126 RepID=A0ABN9SDX0_9DINO|nr:unnamed protein product [Polarella glacialis]
MRTLSPAGVVATRVASGAGGGLGHGPVERHVGSGHGSRSSLRGGHCERGYSQEQWGPWKSHSLLLQQAIAETGWQERAGPSAGMAGQASAPRDAGLHESAQCLLKLFKETGRSKEGHLSRDEFTAVMQRCGCGGTMHIGAFFELFDRNQDGFLNETDFLGGILAVSPSTPHKPENPAGQLRMQFIFLFYDVNRNGLLEIEELAKMIGHIQQLRGQALPGDATADAAALISRYGGPFGSTRA